jgi:uncharacterized membrane protein
VSWHLIHGLLVVTFVIHLLAFVIVYARTRKRRYVFLCCTFACLTALFALKFAAVDPALGPVSAYFALRVLSTGFTATYLWAWWRERRIPQGV